MLVEAATENSVNVLFEVEFLVDENPKIRYRGRKDEGKMEGQGSNINIANCCLAPNQINCVFERF